MSSPDSFPFATPSASTFETALRGYEKRQVDKYVLQVEAEVAALAAEREELYGQINLMSQHLQQVQHDLSNARRGIAPAETAAYRHLGPKVEQILALAEDQAVELRERVEREIADREVALDRRKTELDSLAQDAARNFEVALAGRRMEEEKAAAARRAELAAEVENARAYAARVRSDVDALYAAALQESTRVGDATKAYADKVRAETEAHAALVRNQTDEEVAALRRTAETEVATLRATAEAEVATLRSTAADEVARLRSDAETDVSALRGTA